ncbi:MAG: M28 family peptidase [Methanomassiliicoccales archaeon]|nr:MAG: M28 family peptidase [Methanomassiliicoccales archaeon]
MKKNGLEVKTDEFRSPSTFSWYYGVPCFMVFISLLIFPFLPQLAFIVSISGALFFISEINSIETISHIFPQKRSQNVVARIKSKKSPRKKVVILAHHDTSKPSISFAPRFVKYFRASIVLMIFCVVVIPAIYGISMAFPSNEMLYYITIPFSLYLLIAVLVLIHRELTYEPVPGANDNASGTSVMTSLSKALSSSIPDTTEVWFVSTGCEEVGAIGMIRFLKKYGEELKDAYFINIDNVGRGQIRYTTKEGLIKSFKCSEILVGIASQSSIKTNIHVKGFVNKIYPTNALPCLVRNYRVISILATDDKNLIYNWHWKTDTTQNLDIETINRAYDIVLEMVRSIDSSSDY